MIDYNNRKPYRTKAQKIEARRLARKVSGTWVSSAPVSFHPYRHELNMTDNRPKGRKFATPVKHDTT